MRGADANPWRRLPSLAAFWVGLLYDETCLDAAWDLCKAWTAEERHSLRDDVPRLALKATIRGRSLREWAADCLALAQAGLARRRRLDWAGRDETRHLDPLHEIVAAGRTAAEEMLEKFHGSWGGSVDPVFTEYAY